MKLTNAATLTIVLAVIGFTGLGLYIFITLGFNDLLLYSSLLCLGASWMAFGKAWGVF
jgi:hypothetical protein